ncbi:MAG: glycosyltransferase [Bacteroidetes bacterium]|nr:glycosyltransferase [Bacteroidota bacterium]MBT5530480.1 glycosyltransferase [Cytophagia bacterium]MBT3935833.1 glycosyltransferase [Bacteroidota bacterium]MBT4339023.1 glycosyltransferase [Bacteroidota bacterium]MBT4727417.1 glycosyltransferase [Bacteroidota bacterium]
MPYPLKDGGAIAMYNLSKGLADTGVNLTLLVPITNKHDIDLNNLPESIQKLGEFHSQRINSDITLIGAFFNFFTNKPYYLTRYSDTAFKFKLKNLLKRNSYDIIIIESLKVSMYLPLIKQCSNALVVLRSHNVEHLIWQRLARQTSGLKKLFLNVMVKRLKKFEIGTLNSFDAIAPITDMDGDFFRDNGCKIPLITTPSGIDFELFKADPQKTKPQTFFHLGALDWLPNQEALEWFLMDIWPLIYAEFPTLTFQVAGRNMPKSFLDSKHPGVKIIGEVDDAHAFIKENEVMIVPLISGSGMRIKVIEGMALGKCIISTQVGAEGIAYEDGKNILIADSPQAFLEKTRLLQADKSLAAKIGAEAIKLVQTKYNNKEIIENFLSKLQQIKPINKKHS